MKKSSKITFGAVLSALSVLLMLVSYFPYLTYAVPAVSGLFIMVVFLEIGATYAVSSYIVSAVLSFLLAEKESAVLFICLFGFYPILKAYIDRIKKPVIEWIIKIVLFNLCAFIAYLICSFVIGVSFEELNSFWKYGIYLFWAVCNLAFVLYDIAISRVAVFYFARISKSVHKVFKK